MIAPPNLELTGGRRPSSPRGNSFRMEVPALWAPAASPPVVGVLASQQGARLDGLDADAHGHCRSQGRGEAPARTGAQRRLAATLDTGGWTCHKVMSSQNLLYGQARQLDQHDGFLAWASRGASPPLGPSGPCPPGQGSEGDEAGAPEQTAPGALVLGRRNRCIPWPCFSMHRSGG